MVLPTFSVILAADAVGAIPEFKIPDDLRRFRDVTVGGTVIVGRKTFQGALRGRGLRDRSTIVVSSTRTGDDFGVDDDDVRWAPSLEDALRMSTTARTFVIGGATLYDAVLDAELYPDLVERVDFVYLTAVTARRVHVPASDDGKDSDDAEAEEKCEDRDGARPPRVVKHLSRVVDTWPCILSTKAYTFVPAADSTHPFVGYELTYAYQTYRNPALGLRLVRPMSMVTEHEELQYHALVRRVLWEGVHTVGRTAEPTRSVFGAQLRFSLDNNTLPLFTTRFTSFRCIKEELMTLFIPGATDAKVLADRDVHIWDGNAAAKGGTDLGPIYGFQWRHFGAPYPLQSPTGAPSQSLSQSPPTQSPPTEASPPSQVSPTVSEGVDQLLTVIEDIKRNPASRRHVVSAWNPVQTPAMALPPCHILFQFYVRDGAISCHMFQRSADVGLGLPFNVASYSLLTHLVARECGLRASELVISITDAHIYTNHEGVLLEQLSQHPLPFPKLVFAPDAPLEVVAVKPEHVSVAGYAYHKPASMAQRLPLAV